MHIIYIYIYIYTILLRIKTNNIHSNPIAKPEQKQKTQTTDQLQGWVNSNTPQP